MRRYSRSYEARATHRHVTLEYLYSIHLPMSEDKLAEFLRTGKDWEKVKTTVPGVFILKMPGNKSRDPSIGVEINPVDAGGSPTKRRGLIIRSVNELMDFKDILTNEKVESLLEMIEDVNPESATPRGGSKKVFEI